MNIANRSLGRPAIDYPLGLAVALANFSRFDGMLSPDGGSRRWRVRHTGQRCIAGSVRAGESAPIRCLERGAQPFHDWGVILSRCQTRHGPPLGALF